MAKNNMKILWFPRFQVDVSYLRIETRLAVCRQLQQMGHFTKIAFSGAPRHLKDYCPQGCIRVPVANHRLLRLLSFWILGYAKFLKNYLNFKPDVVILDVYTFWFSLPFCFFPKSKPLFIVDNRGPRFGSFPGKRSLGDKLTEFYVSICFKFTKKFLSGVTVVTQNYKSHIVRDFGIDSSRVGIWGAGVDKSLFSPEKYKNETGLDFLSGKFVLMQHGEISYNRGLFEAVEAIAKLNIADVCLVLIGGTLPGSKAKQELLELAKSLKIEQKIYILDAVDYEQVPKYINNCDCAIMAYPDIEYWNNNNPIKLIEYLSMGKPVICTDMFTFRSVMGDKRCAHYIEDNSPQHIAEAIRYFYKNRESLSSWGKQGIDIVNSDYTRQREVEKLIDFMTGL